MDNWCSFTVDWTIKARADLTKKEKPKMLSSEDYEFDITNIVKQWFENRDREEAASSARNGMILINPDSKSNEVLASNDNDFFSAVLVIKYK